MNSPTNIERYQSANQNWRNNQLLHVYNWNYLFFINYFVCHPLYMNCPVLNSVSYQWLKMIEHNDVHVVLENRTTGKFKIKENQGQLLHINHDKYMYMYTG